MIKLNGDLDAMWELLLSTSRRQQQVFGYHIDSDGMPVWDAPDVPDTYTPGQYEREQRGADDD